MSLICTHSSGPAEDLLYAPPLDVHFIWHCHMLAPLNYFADLQDSELGRAINHRPSGMAQLEKKREKTRPLWTAMFPDEPFDVPMHPDGPDGPDADGDSHSRSLPLRRNQVSEFGYDLAAAAARQKVFYYQVSNGNESISQRQGCKGKGTKFFELKLRNFPGGEERVRTESVPTGICENKNQEREPTERVPTV